MVAFASVCVIWDLNIQRQLRRCTISQNVMFMFSQGKFAVLYSSGIIGSFIKVSFFSQDIFFFFALSVAFKENVWFDMAFNIVDETDVRLPFFCI